jgi:hypothetical protein
MKVSRYLLTALVLLAAARTSPALSPRSVAQAVARMAGSDAVPKTTAAPGSKVNFVGFALAPFGSTGADEQPEPGNDEVGSSPTPAPRAENCDAWQNELVAEGLKNWQVLCKKGRLAEAEQLAHMLASLQPDNPKVRAACTVTQFFKSLAAQMTPDMNCPEVAWQAPPATMVRTMPVNNTCPLPEQLPAPRTCAAPGACPLTGAQGSVCAQWVIGQSANAAVAQCAEKTTCAKDSCCQTAKSCCGSLTTAVKACKCGKDNGCCCETPEARQTAHGDCCPAPMQRMVIELLMPHMPHVPMHAGFMPLRPGMIAPPHLAMLPPGVCPFEMFGHPLVIVERPQPLQRVRMVECEQAPALERTVELRPVAQENQPARLVTPTFDVQCERISCDGTPERLILEGDVRLTFKKTSLRVEARCVIVNMKDGTFMVDDSPESTGVRQSQFGAHRVTLPAIDVRRSIHVVPVPSSPED